MNHSTTPPPSTAVLSPTVPHGYVPGIETKYAVINTTIKRGGDWIASFGMSEHADVPRDPPEYWRSQRMKSGGPQTIELAPDQFYRVRLGGKHFGLYIDADGKIHYFTKNSFFRELERRYRDCVKDVDLTCDGDWSGDPFSRCIPEERMGENKLWLTAS